MRRTLLFSLAIALLGGCDDDSASPRQEQELDAERVLADTGVPDGAVDVDAGCVGTAELCNGLDEDCDGIADEDFPTLDAACALEDGECRSQGSNVCAEDGSGVICDAPPPTPVDEICDNKDNDCDSVIDEGIDLEVDPANCGRCGNVCGFDNGFAGCDEAVCILTGCDAGWGDANGILADGCECAVSNEGVEACDGQDNDCDGAADEGLDVGADCVADAGGCQVEGVIGCDDAGAAVCQHPPVVAMDEICDGVDNDCDGMVDEDFDGDGDGFAGDACPAPFATDCRDDDPAINPEARDVCEDGIDQNCDGADAPCGGTSSWVSRLAVAAANGAGCRDFTGDGRPDNSFSGIAALGNGQIQSAIDDGSLAVLPTAFGLAEGQRDGRFDLAILLGDFVARGTYRIDPASYDRDGEAQAIFVNSLVDDGALSAGPGDFPFLIPFPGANLQLDVSEAMITGVLTLDARGLSIRMGWISGIVPEESLQAALVVLPPEIAQLVPLVLQPDVDRDDDGRPDAYSACLEFDALPATIQE